MFQRSQWTRLQYGPVLTFDEQDKSAADERAGGESIKSKSVSRLLIQFE